jgi:anti-sigma factor RsiW
LRAPAADGRCFEAHVGCPRCAEYLAQIRKTIELTRSCTPDDLTPQVPAELIAIYRHWRAGQDG